MIWQLIVFSLAPLLMNWQKGEEIFEFMYAYMHVYILFKHILFIGCFLTLFDVWQKGGEVLVISCFGFIFCTCSYFVHVYLIYVYVGFMFCTYSYMYMFSCFILDKIEYHLRGSFYIPFISCVITYMFCHHQKGGDCWPKRLHSLFV